MNLFSNIFRGLGLTSVALLLALTLVAAVPSQTPQQDTDGDGLTDNAEEICKTAPTQINSDGDGLTDGEEETHETNPSEADSDGDGLTDCLELKLHRTNPLDPDSDGDSLSDRFEITRNISNPLWVDTDGDGLTDGEEINTHKTHPLKPDSDNDGLSDFDEVNTHKTDPNLADTDEDGLSDSDEVNTHKTDPNLADTDEDGLSDSDEVKKHFTDPLKKDTDGDNLSDGDEVNLHGTHPKKGDTDGDGFTDDHYVDTPDPNSEPNDRNSATGIPVTRVPTPDTKHAAGNAEPTPPIPDGTDAGPTDDSTVEAANPETPVSPADQQEPGETAGFVVPTEPTEPSLLARFGLDWLWGWAIWAVAGIIAVSFGAVLATLFFWWRSKRGGLQELPPDPSAQRAVERRKETKATELQDLSAILSRQAQELRELSFLDAVVSNPPSVNGDMSALLDREQVVRSAVQTLEGLAGPTSERRVAMRQLVESLEREGLKTAALRRAVEGTPATVLHLLLAALQELNEQLGTSLESIPDYLRQVQAARELCNREINDAVARRLPLGLLDVAGEVLQQAHTAPQQRAAQQAAEGILSAVYRQYFPRLRRG